jgi:hypothetical protein
MYSRNKKVITSVVKKICWGWCLIFLRQPEASRRLREGTHTHHTAVWRREGAKEGRKEGRGFLYQTWCVVFYDLMASLDAPRRNKAPDISHDYVSFTPWVTRGIFQFEVGNPRIFYALSTHLVGLLFKTAYKIKSMAHWSHSCVNEGRKGIFVPNLMWCFLRSDGFIGCASQKKDSWYLTWLCFLHSWSHKSTFSVWVWEFTDQEVLLGIFCNFLECSGEHRD